MDNNNMEDEEETSISIMTAEESALNAPSDEALRVPYYCEENVWRLLYRKKHECPDDRFWVVFISNTIKVRKCSMNEKCWSSFMLMQTVLSHCH